MYSIPIDESVKSRFWSKIVIGSHDKCWPWKAAISKTGYGVMRINRMTVKAHRIPFLIKGEDIHGKFVCHKCDNPICCNPDHLFIGSCLDNVRDMHSKGRARKALGSQASNVKLKEDDIPKIRGLKGKMTQREIGILFGVGKNAIQAILSGKHWRHIV